ncbi:helix-turn-helix domain-containing protein [Streptomyces sp. NPDC047097]|uniref:helix-turn-helix domain-containing protein n=1 Tax=Streptomyces sp. NPDC047097 TaxID=3155260 RepID=UPI0033F71EDE
MTVSLAKATDHICLADAARELGVRRATISNWRKRHQDFPPCEEIGGMVRLSRSALYIWLNRGGRWAALRDRQTRAASAAADRKPRVRRDAEEIRRLIARHEAALLRLHSELRRSLKV